jgi:hypothetical protein
MKTLSTLLVVLTVLSASSVFAQHEEAHHGHKHHTAVFFGNTHDHHGEDAFTVGLDYEYKLCELFGVGALVDYAGDDIDSTVLAAGLFIHPMENLGLLIAPGNEHKDGEDEFVVRLGASYNIPMHGFSLAPTIDVDLLSGGHANWIYGIGIGRGF